MALALAVAAAAVAAVLVSHLHQGSSGNASSSTQGTSSAVTGSPVRIVSASAFDPLGDGQEDNSDLPHLYDGNASTVWHTESYSNRQFGSLKSGVGFFLTADQSRRLQDLVLTSPTPGYDVSVYVADSAGSQLSDWGQPVATTGNASSRVILPLRGRQGSHVLVWFTKLSPSDQVQISEARLTS